MEFKSQELQNAEVKPADNIHTSAVQMTVEQVRQAVERYLISKDYNLVKHFNQSLAMPAAAITSEDVIYNIIRSIRSQYTSQVRADDVNFHERLIMIDKIFDAIKGLVDILAIHNIKVSRNEIVASMIGNMLKSLT